MSRPSATVAVLRRPRSMLGVAVALVVVLVWLLAFFLPQGRKLSSLHAQEQALTGQVDAGNAKVAELRVESQHSAQIQAMVTKLGAYAPATSDISYIATLSNTAKAAGLTVASIGPGTAVAVTGSPYSAIPFSVQVEGSYDSVLSFVRAVYALPRLTDIDSVAITGGGPKTDRSTPLSATFQLEIFTSLKPAVAP
ncbi:MAG: type 4a pilus biogenesis protein PilO [Acidimicrobiales bacterium]